MVPLGGRRLQRVFALHVDAGEIGARIEQEPAYLGVPP
ncbi:hypothetical protein CCC_01444 [Paramagnetospirillum magnetotacticum MS-1]|uniref:Uncharacterized protein n=1 Tax=Paramagnetospirillum magnetotacticum MS-1 TaxID=272627 RepID=A0A0C2UVV0_PARME|nr:hypothetical protein CCC_01444 [Paramagnetospirillum magnetotacticum MS-1]